MAKLITNSLINAVDWLKNCPPNWKEKAYNDLFNQLSRIYPKETPKEIQRGLDFEKKLQEVCIRGGQFKASDFFRTFVAYCNGGLWQQTTKSTISVDGIFYCLYGKIDVLFPDKIVDIKTTGNYKGSSYLNSMQHKIYCYNQKIDNFVYKIAEFNNDDSIKAIYEIELNVDRDMGGYQKVEDEIKRKVKDVIDFIEGDETLSVLYHKTFNKYN